MAMNSRWSPSSSRWQPSLLSAGSSITAARPSRVDLSAALTFPYTLWPSSLQTMKPPWLLLHRSIGTSHGTNDAGPTPNKTDSEVSRRELRQLKWLTALVPGTVVLIYEYARQETLEHILPALPVQYGNVVVWVLVLLLTYAFAAFVFRVVERLQAQALARSRDLVTLNAVLEERARLSRELHDGFAHRVRKPRGDCPR